MLLSCSGIGYINYVHCIKHNAATIAYSHRVVS
jgi:hypothetical protein